ncbi:hypothetical protein N656DRAFT_794706 [Canariomyces notabilis]|uniref:Uncharacterized protein n=1 Tax=Canariomyces notabilis TaxID=2074819 RepID=A0AAN6YW92_9PEZI|nr:hypothetical protein N656DRAFT_794706 [Canariomyces arenarius]
MKDLAADVDHLINHVQRQLATVHQHISLLASIRSIKETERSIEQSHRLGHLSKLATVYVPLSFVSSLFGMNVLEISPETTPKWLYFAIALPLTFVSLAAITGWNYWKSVAEWWDSWEWEEVFDRPSWLKRIPGQKDTDTV